MNGLTVVIPSKTVSNLLPCLAAVHACEPSAKIIVIDDGLGEWSIDATWPDVEVIPGKKPFCFARNCNLGIQLAAGDDIVLLNDDALVKTRHGLSLLQSEAEEHPEFGVIASTTNVAGNPHQFPAGVGLRETDRALAFVCVLLPRRTIAEIGLMDERFGGLTRDGRVIYGYCDTDMCRRIRMAKLKIGIHDGCFVDHESLHSSFRGSPRAPGDISLAQELYLAKWGDLS